MKEVLRTFGVSASDALNDVDLPGKGKDSTVTADGIFDNVVIWVFGILGIVAVIILIYGGVLFVLSQGDAGKAQKARQTIIYAIIGIIVVIIAGAITNFVLGAF